MKRFFTCLIVIGLLFPLYVFSQDRGLTLRVKELGRNNRAGKQYLMLIAINRYKSWPPLKNPVKDAREVKEILTSRYYIDDTIELYDEKATKANILRTFTGLQSRLKVNDSLLVYYAGHGHLDAATNSGFWIPVNAGTDKYEQANWLPNTQIRGVISNIKAIHLLVVSDSCFSGDLLNSTRSLPDEISIDYFKRAYSRISRQILTSGASETVPDKSEFSQMLKMALLKNNNLYFDPLMLFNEIRLGVRRTMPMFGNIRDTGHQDGASFLLFLKDAEPESVTVVEPKKTETKKVEVKKSDPVVKKTIPQNNAANGFRDDFDRATLDERWSWIRENKNKWSLTENPGFLTIHTEYGDMYESSKDSKNILVSKPIAGDFNVETKIKMKPMHAWQQAGLIIHWDDDNFLKLNFLYDSDGQTKVEFAKESRGKYTKRVRNCKAPAIYLRIQKNGDRYYGFLSVNGTNFIRVSGYAMNAREDPKICLYAWNGGLKNYTVPAAFDYITFEKIK